MEIPALIDLFNATEEGDGWLALCPAHADSRASLRIAIGEKGGVMLKCRAGCATGDVLKAKGLSFSDLYPEDVDHAPRARSGSAPLSTADIASLAVRLDRYTDNAHPSSAARDYARERFGVSEADFDRLGLGETEELGGGPRLVVPFRDSDGVARGFQARALDRKVEPRWLGPRSPQGGSWTRVGFFPSASQGDRQEVVVTEGPGDALSVCAAGFDAIGVRGAALTSDETAQTILDIAGARSIVVFGDNDRAGNGFARNLVAALARLGCASVVEALPPFDDVTAWREADPDNFAESLREAVERAARNAPAAILARLGAYDSSDLTDLGMAKRLRDRVRNSGSDVRYSPEAGFFLLRSGVWRLDTLDSVRTFAQDSAAAMWAEAEGMAEEAANLPDGDPSRDRALKQAKRLYGWAKHANSTRGIDSAIRELSALSGIATDLSAFDKPEHLLACRNGVVDLRTGALQPHDPDLLLTRRIDLDYQPDALAPRWESFLAEVFPAYPALPDYMRRLVGYGITGSTREQCFAVLYGTGANGKTVFTDTLTEVFGEITETTPFSTFEQKPSGGIPNDLAALKGARLVMAAEGEQGRPMAEAILKRVTGRDLISARFMRKEFFAFRPSFLLLLATNFRPQFRGQDEGLWRRVKLIPWERFFTPDERDPLLGEALLRESKGIFAWAVRGAVEWYADGLQDPTIVRGATKEYRETSDALAGFFPGEFVPDSEGRVSGSLIWDAYLAWAQEENLQGREIWTRRTFFSALEERGLEKRRGSHGMDFVGVRKARVGEGVEPVEVRTPSPALALSTYDNALSNASLEAVTS